MRSLSSPVLRWPDFRTVDTAAREWAKEVLRKRRDILGIAYLGSYARGDWGVGSDLDLLVILTDSVTPLPRRGAEFDTTSLPVPVDLIVYTVEEWQALRRARSRFYETARREAVWLYDALHDDSVRSL